MLMPMAAVAQNNGSLSTSYGGFRNEMIKEYEEFRQQCNLEYAEFMKQAWQEYGAKPPVPIPEQKKIKVLDYTPSQKEKNTMQTASFREVEVMDSPEILESITMQPMPICPIPEVKPAELASMSVKIDTNIGEEAMQRLLPDVQVKRENGIIKFFRKVLSSARQGVGNAKDLIDKRIADAKANQAKNKNNGKTNTTVRNNTPTPTPATAPVEEIVEPTYTDLTFKYFGTDMKVRVIDDYKFKLPNTNEATISDAWKLLATPRFNNTIRDCLGLRVDFNMCDWAYIEMLKTMSDAYFGEGTNESVLFTAFIYCQSGYKMRLARDVDDKLYMLYASKHFLYGRPFFHIEGDDYFIMGDGPSKVFICNNKFQKESNLSLMIPKNVNLAADYGDVRTIKSTRYPDFSIDVKVNKNLMSFYEKYPTSEVDDNFMTRWAMYANTPLNKDIKDQIYPSFVSYLKGKNTEEGVNHLLSLLQTGLEYGYDDDVWGQDRAFFAEETLFYPNCDCEDKSILFSRLVRDLYGLKVLLVYFPGHLLTAVHFNSDDVKGDYCMHNGEKFIFCDPTYRGAPIGRIYSEYEGKVPSVILLQN